MKFIWFDTETTGLLPFVNDIISLACIIVENGEVKEELYLEIQPRNWDKISAKALEVNGYTMEQLKTFMPPQEAYKKVKEFIVKHSGFKKLIPAGHNVIKFDVPFLENFFRRSGDKYLHKYVDYHALDTLSLAFTLKILGKIDVPNIRLGTLADYFGIPLDAHNSLNDIRATREVFEKLKGLLDKP